MKKIQNSTLVLRIILLLLIYCLAPHQRTQAQKPSEYPYRLLVEQERRGGVQLMTIDLKGVETPFGPQLRTISLTDDIITIISPDSRHVAAMTIESELFVFDHAGRVLFDQHLPRLRAYGGWWELWGWQDPNTLVVSWQRIFSDENRFYRMDVTAPWFVLEEIEPVGKFIVETAYPYEPLYINNFSPQFDMLVAPTILRGERNYATNFHQGLTWRNLATNQSNMLVDSRGASQPAWSGDGEFLAYANRVIGADSPRQTITLYIHNRNLQTKTFEAFSDEDFCEYFGLAWSFANDLIVRCHAYRGYEAKFFRLDTETWTGHRLDLNLGYYAYRMDWSPDSLYLAVFDNDPFIQLELPSILSVINMQTELRDYKFVLGQFDEMVGWIQAG